MNSDDKAAYVGFVLYFINENGLTNASQSEQIEFLSEYIAEFNTFANYLPEWMNDILQMKYYFSGESYFNQDNLIYPWKDLWDGGAEYYPHVS